MDALYCSAHHFILNEGREYIKMINFTNFIYGILLGGRFILTPMKRFPETLWTDFFDVFL